MNEVKTALLNLLKVKSIVTIILTVVFSYLSITGEINGTDFLGIFTVIIAFYFGTQYQKGVKSDVPSVNNN